MRALAPSARPLAPRPPSRRTPHAGSFRCVWVWRWLRGRRCKTLPTAALTTNPLSLPTHRLTRRPRRAAPSPPSASNDPKSILETVTKTAMAAADSVAGLVPASVPRPVARGGVLAVGGLLAVSLVGKVVSTVVFWGAVLGGCYLLLKSSGGGGGGGGSGGGSGRADDNDALAEARRIMDKYK